MIINSVPPYPDCLSEEVIGYQDTVDCPQGCTDSSACNYDSDIYFDDGSCEYNSGIWYVSIDGDNSNCGSEDYPFSSIQYAIDSASDGDSIQVAAGTYYENIVIDKSNLTIISKDGIHEAIIDGGENTHVIETLYDFKPENLTMEGFIIQNGLVDNNSYQPGGAGMFLVGETNYFFKNMLIRDNINTYPGGNGGAIFWSGARDDDILNFSNSIFINNSVNGQGSVIYCNSTNAVKCSLINSIAMNNSSGYIFPFIINNRDSSLSISNSIIRENDNNFCFNYYYPNMDINYSNIDGEFCINDVHNIDYFGIGNN